MKRKILILHGPNLNLLGEREPGIYGDTSFEKLNQHLIAYAESVGLEAAIFQSNHEGALIDKLHESRKEYVGVVLNAGAYTHYSYAIADAIKAIKIPVIEVHISNIFARDAFRSNSVIAPVCAGSISGFGLLSYDLAVRALAEMTVKNA
ncbi:MAG: type II 3-dehydroquinate dehydratase [Oscillospiraceae bacterium]|nr:type II 3-dehydroquinate dehydratase [Oscillospiraceae bacterium]